MTRPSMLSMFEREDKKERLAGLGIGTTLPFFINRNVISSKINVDLLSLHAHKEFVSNVHMVYDANDGAKSFGFLFDYLCAFALVWFCMFFYSKACAVM